MNIVLKAFLRSLLRRRALTLIQLSGVACGVAAVVGMVLASNAAIDSFSKTVGFLQGRSTHALSRTVGPMSENVLAELRVRSAARTPGRAGRRQRLKPDVRSFSGRLFRLVRTVVQPDCSGHPVFPAG